MSAKSFVHKLRSPPPENLKSVNFEDFLLILYRFLFLIMGTFLGGGGVGWETFADEHIMNIWTPLIETSLFRI